MVVIISFIFPERIWKENGNSHNLIRMGGLHAHLRV